MDEETEPARPPDERARLIASITIDNNSLVEIIRRIRANLLRLDEMGAPVTRSRTRAEKMEVYRSDWWSHFEYDVVNGNTKGTKEQQVRAERYELS